MQERVFDPDQDKAPLQGTTDTPLETIKPLKQKIKQKYTQGTVKKTSNKP